MEVSANELKKAVESQHGGKAVFVTKLAVKRVFEAKTAWDGVIHIFDLEGNAKATRAYAWSSPVEGGDKRRFYAVLIRATSARRWMRYGRLSRRSDEAIMTMCAHCNGTSFCQFSVIRA